MSDRDNDIVFCIDHRHFLWPREIEFLESIIEWDGALTEAQGDWLDAILEKVEGRLDNERNPI